MLIILSIQLFKAVLVILIITYSVSSGEETIYIDGGSGYDTLTINRGAQSFTVLDQHEKILYQHGAGGTEITVGDIEQTSIVPPM